MQRIVVLFGLFLSALGIAQAQETTVKGKIKDIYGLSIELVSVTMLIAVDSILYKNTRTLQDGSFRFTGIRPGSYILRISHTGFEDYNVGFSIKDADLSKDFGVIAIHEKTRVLDEVVINVKRVSAITIKGDTIEFHADSFTVRPNARVEDLLRQFPNVEVDRQGRIVASGETVQRVLLDGEEFFGDDPTLITKNIRADMVEKVQIYDDASDRTKFTGINDGQKQKTINVTLKEDKQNGDFGKAQLGGGLRNFYDGQIMYNLFNKNRKISGYGIFSNDGKTGLIGDDKYNFGDPESQPNELDSWNGKFSGKGLPIVKTGGLHFDEKFNSGKLYVNGNYKIADLSIKGIDHMRTESIRPGSNLNSRLEETFDNNVQKNKADVAIVFKPDANNSVNVQLEGLMIGKKLKSRFFNESFRDDGTILNQNNRNIIVEGTNKELAGNIIWNKKLSKMRRTFSTNVSGRYSNSDFGRNLYSKSSFYHPNGTIERDLTVNEKRLSSTYNSNYAAQAIYTEPLGAYLSLLADYRLEVNGSGANTEILNESVGIIAGSLETVGYNLRQYSHKAKASLHYSGKRLFIQLSPGFNLSRQVQNSTMTEHNSNRSFINWYPYGEFKYIFPRKNRVILSYEGKTIQPSLSQLQPLAINDDPLNIFVGNAGLTPSFKQTINLNYRDYIVMKDKTILFNGVYTRENNPIVPKVTIDSVGRSIYEYTNLSTFQPRTLNFYFIYSFNIKPVNIKLNSDAGFYSTQSANYINNDLNRNRVSKTNFSLGLSKREALKYEVSLKVNANYNQIRSTLNSNPNTSYWNYIISPEVFFYPKAQLEVLVDASYNFQQKVSFSEGNFNQYIFNVSVCKYFFKAASLAVRLSANDLFDQNRGINRFVSNNLLVENTYTTVRRNVMLSVIWDLNKISRN